MHLVKDVMSRSVQVISPDATIAEAARRMRDGNFGMMPVGENDRVIGSISDRDIAVRAVADGRGSDAKVRDAMSDVIRWAYEDEPIKRAVAIMSEHLIRRLLIVNREKRLVGIVALADLAVKKPKRAPAAETPCEISEPA